MNAEHGVDGTTLNQPEDRIARGKWPRAEAGEAAGGTHDLG
jgi:hypothetical protein